MTNDALPVFPTKVDRWLVLVLACALGWAALTLGAAFSVAHSAAEGLAILGIPLFVVALVGVLSIPTRYEFHEDALVVRSGVVRYRFRYPDIRGAVPSRNPLSAPAWSLDRLRLDLPRGYALVSPRDKDGFLAALAARTPQLERRGERLVARGR